MTIGTPEPFRGGQGLVEWTIVIATAIAVAVAFNAWRSA
jgi:hypothetical protein